MRYGKGGGRFARQARIARLPAYRQCGGKLESGARCALRPAGLGTGAQVRVERVQDLAWRLGRHGVARVQEHECGTRDLAR